MAIHLFVSVLSDLLVNFIQILHFQVRQLSSRSLSVIVLFFIFFRCRSNTEISKNVQGTPCQCPPSLNTTDACTLFPRNVNCLTVRPPVGCGLRKSDLGKSHFLHDCPMLIWPEMTSRPTNLSTTFHWGLWFLILSLWFDSNQEKPIKSMLYPPKLKFNHFGCCPLVSQHACSLRNLKTDCIGNQGYFHALRKKKKSFLKLHFQSYSCTIVLKFYPVLNLGVFNSTNSFKS